jgi:4-diphosphocytidyl-2-C-methyl-D-erythritol kinase
LTLFQRISLSDTIRIRKIKRGFQLSCNHPKLRKTEDNIIFKAYQMLAEKFPRLGGVSVRLRKKIPLGAGLGGGSSNAAHFLLGMKKLFRLKISLPELLRMGKRLGADVPFFLLKTPLALAWGIGDQMQSLPSRGGLWFLLLVTEKGLNTKKVYQNLKAPRKPLSLTKEKRVAIILRSFFEMRSVREAARLAKNDLETSAISLRPSISKAINTLHLAGAPFVLMSGSGATVFAILSSRKEAEGLAHRIKQCPVGYRKIICRSY